MGIFSKLNDTVNQFDPMAKNCTSQNYNSGYNLNSYGYAQPTPIPAYQTYRPYQTPQNNGYPSQPSAPAPQQYSSPWVAQWDPTSRSYYYVNRVTGERSWNNPDMAASREISQCAPMAAAPMAVDPNANGVGQTGPANTMNDMNPMAQGAGIGDVAQMGLAVVDGFGGLVNTTKEITGNDGKDDDGGDDSDSDSDGGLWSKIKKVVKDAFDSDSDSDSDDD